MLKNGAQLKLLGTNDNFYYVNTTRSNNSGIDIGVEVPNVGGVGIKIDNQGICYIRNAENPSNLSRILTVEDLKSTKLSLNYAGMISWNASSVAPAPGMAVFGGTGSDQQVYLKFKPAGSTTEYSINCGYNNDAGLSGTFILNTGDKAWSSNGCAGYFIPFS